MFIRFYHQKALHQSLWKDKDGSRVHEAAELMKLTANDLYEMKIIDKIIKEPRGGITKNREICIQTFKNLIFEILLKN